MEAIEPLYISNVLIGLSIALCVTFVAIGHDKKLLTWAVAFALYPISFLIFGLRPMLPSWFTITAGNTALIAMFAMFTEGLCRLHGIKFPRIAIWLPLPIGILGFIYLLDDLQGRIDWGAYLAALHSFFVIYIGLMSLQQSDGRGRWIMFAAILGSSGTFLIRAALLLAGYRASVNFLVPGLAQTILFSMAMVFLVMFAIGLLVTYKERAEREITRLALQDPLTQLGNRLVLQERLENAFINSVDENRYGALMMLDLDHFKELNDTHGHGLGDQLLIEVAYRLKDCVSDSDTVIRLGGDEFVLLIENLDADEGLATQEAETISQRALRKLTVPYHLQLNDGQPLAKGRLVYNLTVSIGVALFKGKALGREDLLRNADTAMYKAKQHGRNRVQLYQFGLESAETSRLNPKFRAQALASRI